MTLYHGASEVVMKSFADSSIDAIVTDPPYELGFMGKGWDSSGIAYSVELWAEALRVLKPGGHLLAFGGSRTWHRMAVAIEDSGFELRDSIAWLYGSGFPKSLDVSKAIDKLGGVARPDHGEFRDACRGQMRELGVRVKDVDAALGNVMSARYFTNGAAPALPKYRDYVILRELLQLGDRFQHLYAEEAEREPTGVQTSPNWRPAGSPGVASRNEIRRDAPASDAATTWSGWGTALKPGFEPVVVARKPLAGTVAANVLAHGTGGLNVAACRVGSEERTNTAGGSSSLQRVSRVAQGYRETVTASVGTESVVAGRWPTNVVLDESQAEALDAQTGVLTSGSWNGKRNTPKTNGILGDFASRDENARVGDSGGASRFFPTFKYEAKAPSSERPVVDGVAHATVKPLALMRWLVRLVTPPGGVVLDPFAGSGTTLEAAVLEGFETIGIELGAEHLPLIRHRFAKPLAQGFDLGDIA
ncbi:DNA methyltransferase [Pseudoclavibacter sp. VKM Ac-2888]|uniref:DNA methyltransferase n=1 Tax=Pseudoclavibacter sp. VKM Ac-2888 TaxID=2783830 RepID=UPI002B271AED|nr:DNA methyltransferase [Pseudoclavibacter sp. VKM Ac-2888]